MTSCGGVIYAKKFWDTTLAPRRGEIVIRFNSGSQFERHFSVLRSPEDISIEGLHVAGKRLPGLQKVSLDTFHYGAHWKEPDTHTPP